MGCEVCPEMGGGGGGGGKKNCKKKIWLKKIWGDWYCNSFNSVDSYNSCFSYSWK